MKKYDLILFMGDSYTVGFGQADDVYQVITNQNRYSALVSQYFNLEEVNIAEAGISNHFIARTLYNELPNFKNKNINPLVIVSYTSYNRLEILNETLPYYKDYLIDSFNEKFNLECSKYYILSVRALLNSLQMDFIETSSLFKFREAPELINNQCLPDDFPTIVGADGCFKGSKNGNEWLGHLNITGHKMIAERIIEKINDLYIS
jgi:lysophospholipase L1-like esterase